MIKKYDVDEEIRRKLLRTQYKKHPLWKRRLWVRVILNIFPIVIAMFVGYCTSSGGYYHHTGMERIFIVMLFSICFGMLASAVPITYFSQLRYHCLETLNYRLNESVVLTDEEIEDAYLKKGNTFSNMYSGYRIPYKNIERVIYNKYHQRIDIIGKHNEIGYKDYYKGEIGGIEENKYQKGIRIYLYFNNNEDLINTISERSGVKIETINYSEGWTIDI